MTKLSTKRHRVGVCDHVINVQRQGAKSLKNVFISGQAIVFK